MDNTELERKISETQSALERLQNASDQLIPEITQVIAKYVIDWMDSLVSRMLKEKSEIIESLGGDKLAQFKGEIDSLKARMIELVTRYLSEIDWPHKRSIPTNVQGVLNNSNDIDKSLNKAVRLIIGETGKIFIKYGCANIDKTSEWQKDEHGRICYGFGLPSLLIPSEKEFAQIKEKYSRMIAEQGPVLMELAKLTQELKGSRAEDLWKHAQ
jgi:hypothetical protein